MKLSFLNVRDAYGTIQPVFTCTVDFSDFSFSCNGHLATGYETSNIFGNMPHAFDGTAEPKNINDTKIIISSDNLFYFYTLGIIDYIDLDEYGNFPFHDFSFTENPNLHESSFSSNFRYQDTLISYAFDSCTVYDRNGSSLYTSAYVTFHRDDSGNPSFIMLYTADRKTTDGRVYYVVYKIPLTIKYTNCCLKACVEPTKYIYYK